MNAFLQWVIALIVLGGIAGAVTGAPVVLALLCPGAGLAMMVRACICSESEIHSPFVVPGLAGEGPLPEPDMEYR